MREKVESKLKLNFSPPTKPARGNTIIFPYGQDCQQIFFVVVYKPCNCRHQSMLIFSECQIICPINRPTNEWVYPLLVHYSLWCLHYHSCVWERGGMQAWTEVQTCYNNFLTPMLPQFIVWTTLDSWVTVTK